ncbi:MAG: sensor histidine kinase [Myxococcota bacterium]
MNFPIALTLFSAAACLLFAVLWLFVSRAPGWHDTRALSLVSLTAGLYSLTDLAQLLPVSDAVALWAGSLSVAVSGLHCGAWLLFLEARDRRPLSAFERATAWGGVALAVLALVPRVMFTGAVEAFTVPWLDATWRVPRSTPVGTGLLLYFLSVMGIIAVRVSRRWNEGWRQRAPAVWGALMVLLGMHDALVVARVIDSPLLVDLGFLVGTVGYGLLELSRLADDAQRLERLSTQLEQEVQTRTEELAGAQRALARTEVLEAIGQLSAGVAHELNNPAAVVLSNLRYVRGALAEGTTPPDDAVEALDDATVATERITRIVRDLSDAGRIASRKQPWPSPPCDVDAVLTRALETLRVDAGAPLTPRLEGVRQLHGRVDAVVLEKVVLSLLHNAVAATEGVAQPTVVLDTRRHGDEVHVEVRDNGGGVAKEHVAHLFEPFFTTRIAGRGRGLGLPVARGLMVSQGGDLRFGGNTPDGTRFVVTFPAA